MQGTSDDRLKASYKIALNNRFSLKKAQFEENIQQKFNDLNQQFSSKFQNEAAELINLKVKIASMEKTQEQKTKLLIEQEVLLRQSINKIAKPIIVRPTQRVDVNLELEQTLQMQQDLNIYLKSKIQKLVGVLVCLKLYTADYGVKIQQDDFNVTYLLMPKMPNYEPVVQSLMDKNAEKDLTIKSQAAELEGYRKENTQFRRQMARFDVSNSLDVKKYQKLIQQYQEQAEDQQLQINELMKQLNKNKNNNCKELDDILVKKRFRSLHQQPTFNLHETAKKFILQRNSIPRICDTPNQSRIHSKTLNFIK